MKISAIKLFESSSLDQETAEKIAPLIDFVNTLADQSIRALSGKLNFTDNIDSQLIEFTCKHGIKKDVVINYPQRVIGVLIIKVLHDSDSCEGINWNLNKDNTLAITPYLRLASSDDRKIRALVIYS